jgi:hypothetical protein
VTDWSSYDCIAARSGAVWGSRFAAGARVVVVGWARLVEQARQELGRRFGSRIERSRGILDRPQDPNRADPAALRSASAARRDDRSMSEGSVHLDYNATTPLLPEVAGAMAPYLEDHFG